MSEKENTITKLRSTGDNWSIWKFQVKVLLQSKELYGYVTGEEKEPKKTDTDNWKKWKKKDCIAVELIVSRIDEGEPISEKLIITKILTSLSTEYGYFISAWESMTENKRTLDILTARLMSESERTNQGKENLNFNSSNANNALIGKTKFCWYKKYKKNDKINKNAAFVGLDLSEMNSVLVDFNDDETWIADSGASEHT
ncbi:hypothetical protein ILUMI_17261, partial [Ignelater luminosus]